MILTRKHYAVFTLGFIVFVIYASLVPLKFSPISWQEGVNKFLEMMSAPIHAQWKADWVSNILLFMPLGYGMMAAFHTDRQSRLWGMFIVLPCCAFFSTSIEFAQIWFPPRHTNPNDVAAESIGGFIGVLTWMVIGPWFTQLARDIWNVHGGRNWAFRLFPAYLFVLVLVNAAPFDISISPSELMHKYREKMIRPYPFDLRAGDNPIDFIEKTAFTVGYFIPAGVLLAAMRRPNGNPWFSLRMVLLFGVVLASAIEFMQIFILSHFADTTDILTGTFGAYLGWCLVKLNQYDTSRLTLSLRFTSLVVWSVLLVAIHWFPFEFQTNQDYVQKRCSEFNWMPFAEYQSGNYLNSFNNIFRKTLLFVPLGMILERILPAMILSGIFAVLIETGQFFIPARYPGITDPLIETVGAMLGAIAATRLRKFTATETP